MKSVAFDKYDLLVTGTLVLRVLAAQRLAGINAGAQPIPGGEVSIDVWVRVLVWLSAYSCMFAM